MSETLVTAEEQKEKLKSQLTEEMYGYKVFHLMYCVVLCFFRWYTCAPLLCIIE